jgi:hypothetical protein
LFIWATDYVPSVPGFCSEEGVNIEAAKDAIVSDILSKGALPAGLTTGTVNVAGKLLTYNAYKLADGTINVGRVTVK